jgi:hypothetical protein
MLVGMEKSTFQKVAEEMLAAGAQRFGAGETFTTSVGTRCRVDSGFAAVDGGRVVCVGKMSILPSERQARVALVVAEGQSVREPLADLPDRWWDDEVNQGLALVAAYPHGFLKVPDDEGADIAVRGSIRINRERDGLAFVQIPMDDPGIAEATRVYAAARSNVTVVDAARGVVQAHGINVSLRFLWCVTPMPKDKIRCVCAVVRTEEGLSVTPLIQRPDAA